MFAWSASPVTQPENENDRVFFVFVFVKNKLIFILNTYWCCLVTNKGGRLSTTDCLIWESGVLIRG